MFSGRELSNRKFQMDSLDGLRGLAVLIVFLSHTSNRSIHLLPYADFSGIGKSGVYLFFLLSSFLLTYPFVAKGRSAFRKDFLINYSVRRVFRIYPLYLVYLLLGVVTTVLLWRLIGHDKPVGVPFVLSGSEFVQHLLLSEGKGVTWSILVEFHFYFVLPILAFIFSVALGNRLVSSVVFTTLLVIATQMIWPEADALRNDSRLGPYNWRNGSLHENKVAIWLVELMGLISVVFLVAIIPSVATVLHGSHIPYNHYHNQFILYGVLWLFVVFASINGSGVLALSVSAYISGTRWCWTLLADSSTLVCCKDGLCLLL